MSYDSIIRRLLPNIEFHQNRYARLLDGVVFPGCRWLDIGAGGSVHGAWVGPSGQQLRSRARFLLGCDLVAHELESNPCLSAGIAADCAALPFPDGAFDLVTANMVVEHLSDPAPIFTEVARVLGPRGNFVFVTPNRAHPAVWALAVLVPPRWRRELAHRVERRPREAIFLTHYQANTRGAVQRLARQSGLGVELLEVFYSSPMARWPDLAVVLEALWIRAGHWGPLRGFGSNIIACLQKPVGHSVESRDRSAADRRSARAAATY